MNSTLGRLAFGKTLRNGGGSQKIAPRRFFASGWKPRLRMTGWAPFLCHPEVSAAKAKDLREAMIVCRSYAKLSCSGRGVGLERSF
jgi:hypothetical protein